MFARLVLAALAGLCLACSAAAESQPAKPPRVPAIVVDQFGYLPDARKVAIVRDPQVGFDAAAAFSPGENYAVVDVATGETVHAGSVTPWNGGATDAASGDRTWWFDFSPLTRPGRYRVVDVTKRVGSDVFEIGPDVYRPVLKQAMRVFFYQRAGFAKAPPHAEEAWADGASHVGPRQDGAARRYDRPGDRATERDLRGGWYDAGDYNKYTSWTANYVMGLLDAYRENPAAFGDDFDIPKSGNGVSDLLDEVKWGVDWLVRMQEADGSVLSVVGLASAIPPSAATGPSLYGEASTSATLSAAAAFAVAAEAYGKADSRFAAFAADLRTRAERAWTWAEANPAVTFRNNDKAAGSEGLAAGQQEVDDATRRAMRLRAAAHLFALTGDAAYRRVVEQAYRGSRLIENPGDGAFEWTDTRALLRYAALPAADPAAAAAIRRAYAEGIAGWKGLAATRESRDPYRAFMGTYHWGITAAKTHTGSALYALGTVEAREAAAGYLHWMHGANPLGLVYLSNMGRFGAERSVDQFYHTWFAHGSAFWDSAAESRFGPAPGFVVGGPNPFYKIDGCCPAGCGDNSRCRASPSPPAGQPPQKSYLEFNDGWPLNSWEVTENSNGYQTEYVRLLSKFVR